MALIANIASTYIEENKDMFLKKYYSQHDSGSVILFFNKDGSLYRDEFMTSVKIMTSRTLPTNAYYEARGYWCKYPNQLIFLSWFYPIEEGTPFSIYALGTIRVEHTIKVINEDQKNELLRKINEITKR
ncbi:MAG: hypothetical protein V7K98_19510 [Nostoc sp.]|uniref:hypothetical protein n=1 Tax=Nostoc sp. TaxID=1180 RepID=UPI002FFAA718